MAAAVHLDLHHDIERAVAWHPGGGLTLANGRDALTMRAELPPIPAADRALAEIRAGRVDGLSVEFRALKERREGGLRVIEDAELRGIGIVRAPSYGASRVEARRRSGRRLRARIPAERSVECRCSGAVCKFAKMAKEGMEEAFEKAFRQFEREVVAGFGSYDSPLASASAGTLRGRILPDGDGEVEIDLPDDSNGAAVIAANEAAGVIVRPHIDADGAESTIEGETRIYTRMPISGVLGERHRCPRGLARTGDRAGRTGARQRAASTQAEGVSVTSFFETRTIPLTGAPVDLATLAGIASPPTALGQGFCFIQNTSEQPATLYWRETAAQPAATDRGHVLAAGDAIEARIFEGRPFWVWGTGEITISPTAPSEVY